MVRPMPCACQALGQDPERCCCGGRDRWRLSADTINAIASERPYEVYIAHGLGGDIKATDDVGSFRVRLQVLASPRMARSRGRLQLICATTFVPARTVHLCAADGGLLWLEWSEVAEEPAHRQPRRSRSARLGLCLRFCAHGPACACSRGVLPGVPSPGPVWESNDPANLCCKRNATFLWTDCSIAGRNQEGPCRCCPHAWPSLCPAGSPPCC